MESLILVRVFGPKWLENSASVRLSLLHLESFLRDFRNFHVDAFRDLLVVVLGRKQNAKLLHMINILVFSKRDE